MSSAQAAFRLSLASRLTALLILALCLTGTSRAQSPFTTRAGSDVVPPSTSYPIGQAELVAENAAASLRLANQQRGLCERFGCVAILNETDLYDVARFHIDRGRTGEERKWGPNMLDWRILPRRGLVRVKSADRRTCHADVLFVLRNRQTDERVNLAGHVNFCATPNSDSLVRIRMVRPEVRVGE